MDPVTILTVAGMAFTAGQKAFEAGQALGAFINDVKYIDQSLGLLVNEVKSLSAACELVGTRIKGIAEAMDAASQKDSKKKETALWSQVKTQLEDCTETITALHEAVKDVGLEKKKNPFAQAWRQIQLNMKTKDIEEARNRIRSHTASLQLVLQAITLELSYLAPHKADQQLLVLLENIRDIKKELTEMRHKPQEQGLSDTELRHDQKEDELIKYTDNIITSGETLYEGSIAGGSVVGPSEGLDEKITSWVSRLQVLNSETATSDPFDDYDARATSSVSGADLGTATDITSDSGFDGRPGEYEDSLGEEDEGDDLEIEMIKEAFDLGKTEFQNKQYSKANMLLQEVLTMVEESPMRSSRILDIRELQWMLAVCAYHTEDYAAAEAALKVIVQTPPQSQEDRVRLCDAGHILALAALKQNKLTEARQYCDSALQGRRRLLGKQDPACYESLALLARIFELQDNSARAVIYARMIPEDQREAICAEFKNLDAPSALVGDKKTEAGVGKELPPLPPGPPPYAPTESPVAQPSSATSASSPDVPPEQRWKFRPPIPTAKPAPDPPAESKAAAAPADDDVDDEKLFLKHSMTNEVSNIINGRPSEKQPQPVPRTSTWATPAVPSLPAVPRLPSYSDSMPLLKSTELQRQNNDKQSKIEQLQEESARAQKRYGKRSGAAQNAVQQYATAVHEMDLKRPAAENMHKDVLKQIKTSLDDDHPLTYVTYANLAKIAENNGDFNKSSDYYQKVLDGMKRHPADDSAQKPAAAQPASFPDADAKPEKREMSRHQLRAELRAMRRTYGKHLQGSDAADVAKTLKELRLNIQSAGNRGK